MTKAIQVLSVAVAALVAMSVSAFAADGGSPSFVLLQGGAGAIAAALTIMGAGYGIGRIGSSALESMARQPEVAGNIQTAMIIAAALVEGATFFALIVCIIHGGPFAVGN